MPLDIFSGKSLHFNRSEYFEKLCKALPAEFSEVRGNHKHIRYFLQRMMGRCPQLKYILEEYWKNRQVENYLNLAPETFQHDLEGKLHMAIHGLLKIESM